MIKEERIKTISTSANIAVTVDTVICAAIEILMLVAVIWYGKNYELAWDGLASNNQFINETFTGILGMAFYLAFKLLLIVLIPFLVISIVTTVFGILEFNGNYKPVMTRIKVGSILKIVHSVMFIVLDILLVIEFTEYFALLAVFHLVVLVLAIINLVALKKVTITEVEEND